MTLQNTIVRSTATVEASAPIFGEPCTLVVDAGTGTVVLEVQVDTATDAWVTHETYDADGAYKIEANGCNIRISVTGDAAYALVRP